MPEFKITIRTGNQHYHIAYINDKTMQGTTSESKGHSHQIVFTSPPPLTYIDQMTGIPQQEVLPPKWIVYPAGKDSHTHELTDYIPKETKKNFSEKEDYDTTIRLYKEWKELEREARVAGLQSEGYYDGTGQWDNKTKEELIKKERAAETVNKLEHNIDLLSGYQRQNRTEPQPLPTEEGDQRGADILKYVFKNIDDLCDYQREKTKVFEDEAIVGRGVLHKGLDFDKDIKGRIIISRFPWYNCAFGPHSKDDLSDCEGIVKEERYSKGKIKELYPNAFPDMSPTQPETEFSAANAKTEDGNTSHGMVTMSTTGDLSDDTDDVASKDYLVIECQRKIYRRVFVLANDDGFVYNAEGWAEVDIKSAKSIDGFHVITRNPYSIRLTKVIETKPIVLERDYVDWDTFDLFPVYAKKRSSPVGKVRFWGKIEGGKGLQNLINKTYSQFIDILNKMAAYGWFYDSNTFDTNMDKKIFLASSTSPGFIAKIANTEHPPRKEEGVKFPVELVNAIAIFNDNMREIMSINLELMGNADKNTSGVAMRQKITQQLLGNDYLYDNLSMTEKILWKSVIKDIQKIYTPERILRIIINQSQKSKEPLKIGGRNLVIPGRSQSQAQQQVQGLVPQNGQQPMPSQQDSNDQITLQEVTELLSTLDFAYYDVTIGESPASPSAMMSIFSFLLEMAGKGMQAPVSSFLKFAPIPQAVKDEILEQVKQQQTIEAQKDQMKYGTEIKKSMIAQQGKMMDRRQGGQQQ